MAIPNEAAIAAAAHQAQATLEEARAKGELAQALRIESYLSGMHLVLALAYGEDEAERVWAEVAPRTPEPGDEP